MESKEQQVKEWAEKTFDQKNTYKVHFYRPPCFQTQNSQVEEKALTPAQ